jgi:hypothetical protein
MLDTLENAGALPPSLDVTEVDVIEREPGHAAKLKLVKTCGPGQAAGTHRRQVVARASRAQGRPGGFETPAPPTPTARGVAAGVGRGRLNRLLPEPPG